MSEGNKSNRSAILQAVKTKALYYVSKEFLGDREVILTAFKYKDGLTFNFDYDPINPYSDYSKHWDGYYHTNVRESFTPLIEIIQKQVYFNDPEVALHIMKMYPSIITSISENLINNKEFIKECLKINGNCFEFIPDHLKNDLDLCSTALTTYRDAIIHFPVEIQTDKRIFNLLLENITQNSGTKLQLFKEIKQKFIDTEYSKRKEFEKLDEFYEFNLDSIPDQDLIENCKLLYHLREKRLEDNYYSCYLPIKS